MNWGQKILLAVFGGLIAYYVSDIFVSSLITDTSTAGGQLVSSVLPIVIAGGLVYVIVTIAFRSGD